MSRATDKVATALMGASWDVGAARERIKLIASNEHNWEDPKAVVIDAIDSAMECLKAARKAAEKL